MFKTGYNSWNAPISPRIDNWESIAKYDLVGAVIICKIRFIEYLNPHQMHHMVFHHFHPKILLLKSPERMETDKRLGLTCRKHTVHGQDLIYSLVDDFF